jgi:hypothetical protein
VTFLKVIGTELKNIPIKKEDEPLNLKQDLQLMHAS